MNKKPQVIDLLFEFDCDLDFAADGGNTALHEACRVGNLDAVDKLIYLGKILYFE